MTTEGSGMERRQRSGGLGLVLAAGATAFALAACGGGGAAPGDGNGAVAEAQPISADEIDAVLKSDTQIDLTLWGWASAQYTPAIEAFEAEYPNIKIDFVVQSGSTDMYTKYQNAVDAGTGIPDVMQWEYYAIPQYAVTGSLLNFASDSLEAELAGSYNASAWNDVHVAGGLYGLPTDQGPTVMFYRQDILDQFGLPVPTTWAEVEEVGIALHEADPDKSLMLMPVDTTAGAFINQLRFADAQPWSLDGLTSVSLDMQNERVKEASEYLRRNIDAGVIKLVSSSSDDYNRSIAEGDVVMTIDGAWRKGIIEANFPEQAGNWRVAVPPIWGDAATQTHNSVSGGSAFAISADSSREHQVAAVAFANWVNSAPESVDILVGQGLFSAANAYQQDASAASATSDFYGDQAVNQVLFDAANAVDPTWQTLPFMQELDTVYLDTVLPVLSDGGDVFAAVGTWQTRVADWAQEQGFDVSTTG